MANPEPPQPTPFPIRIIQDPPNNKSSGGDDESVAEAPPAKPRRDEFYDAWDKFLALEPKRGKKLSRPARAVKAEQKEVDESSGCEGRQVQENAATSWEQAAAQCRAKVAAIVEECMRLNQKYKDAMFDLEADEGCLMSLDGRYPQAVDSIKAPPWIKRVEDIFDDPKFFIDGASPQDVHQGSGGDCWFLAALMAVSAKKELIDRLCIARDEKVGVYGFVFYRDGEWIYEVIDDKLFMRVGDDDDIKVVRDWSRSKQTGQALSHDKEKLRTQLQRGGEALYFSHCKSSETWLPLIEKAYAKAHGDYFAIEGGFASEAIEDLTGGVGAHINPEDILDKDRFWRDQMSQVNVKYLFGGGSKPSDAKGIVSSHAYTVLRAYEEGDLKLLKVRNPWGNGEWEGDWADGSKQWTPEMMKKLDHTFGDDGVFWMSYKDFLKHYPSINRVRLFNEDWQVAQQWTSVNVPWTVDYLDTKFQFSIEERCPVVVVLSQPDDRYFYGLEGRFLRALHFRVYKDGDDEGRYIVRSMHTSGNETIYNRSVSAEIEDLEAGTYNVVVKITATRLPRGTSEESILKFAKIQKEKLLSVGRRYDYALTKGNMRAMEQANKKSREDVKREAIKSSMRTERKIQKADRTKTRRKKKRVDDAMKERRKVVEAKRREQAISQRRRRSDRSVDVSTKAQAGVSSEERSEGDDRAATPASTESPSKTSPVKEDDEVRKDLSEPTDEPPTAAGAAEKSSSPIKGDSSAPQGADADQDREPPSVKVTAEPVDEKEEDVSNKTTQAENAGDISEDLSKLSLTKTKSNGSANSKSDPVSPLEESDNEDEEDEGESSAEDLEQMEDDDFDWDSEIDDPIFADDYQDSRRNSAQDNTSNEIFASDPWNAVCVLGLRIYSRGAVAKVKVVKAENDS